MLLNSLDNWHTLSKVAVGKILIMADKSRAQALVEYGIARMVLGFLALLPRRGAVAVGIGVGSVGFRVLSKLRSVGLRNLELAYPEKSVAERRAILKEAFHGLGRTLGIVGGLGKVSRETLGDLIEYDPDTKFAAAFEKARVEKRGMIILTGHIGNWELFALAYSILFGPSNLLSRRMDNPMIDKMVAKMRSSFGNRQIDKTKSARPILRILRDGGSVGILADVNSHPKEGVFAPFFGIAACTTAGVAMLALRANAVIVPMFAVWNTEKGRYILITEKIIEPINSGDRKTDVELITAEFTAAIERVVRAYPDQWIWIHRRWKTRPVGEPNLYTN